MRHRPLVVLVTPPRATATGSAIFHDVFAAAEEVSRSAYRELAQDADESRVVTVEHIDLSGDGLAAAPAAQDADLVILAACRLDPAADAIPGLAAWLRRQHASGALVAASGDAVFHLAASRVLDGCRVAAPRWCWQALRRRFPAVLIDPDARLSVHGRAWCAAYPPDDFALALSLLAAVTTPRFAQVVARETGLDHGGQAAPALWDAGDLAEGDLVRRTCHMLKARLAEPVAIAQLARGFGTSVRTLNRRFRAEMGQTPLAYLQDERIAVARRMLAKTDYRIARVASLVGYADAVAFARVFRRRTGQSPQAWRLAARAPC